LVRNSARRRERNARFACLGCCYDPFGAATGDGRIVTLALLVLGPL
jgi:hypothetical protein